MLGMGPVALSKDGCMRYIEWRSSFYCCVTTWTSWQTKMIATTLSKNILCTSALDQGHRAMCPCTDECFEKSQQENEK